MGTTYFLKGQPPSIEDQHSWDIYDHDIDGTKIQVVVKAPHERVGTRLNANDVKALLDSGHEKLKALLAIRHNKPFHLEIEGRGQATFKRKPTEQKPHLAFLLRQLVDDTHPLREGKKTGGSLRSQVVHPVSSEPGKSNLASEQRKEDELLEYQTGFQKALLQFCKDERLLQSTFPEK